MKSVAPFFRTLTVMGCLLFAGAAQAEVLLQWFETDWDEMYQKLPKVAEIGYDSLWIPPPTKGPVGASTKWANVGYNLYDRFDVGDVPQRGTLATRYGTRGSLRAMVNNAHGLDIKIIPDIVMNHNGNGPDFREYPGMTATDFHVQWQQSYANTLNYKRAPRMNWWYHQEGYGATMWSDLANLADIRTEDHPLNGDPKRFTGQKTDPDGQSFNFVDGTSYLRHVGQYDRYPYYPSGYTNENAAQLLYRWIAWLGTAIDYDGLRLDAGKHTPYEFFGWRGSGFLHEAQWSYTQRRGYAFGGNPTDLFSNDRDRTNAFIFAEILSPWSEIEYWYRQGTGNPMRFLDYQMKKTADACFGGNLSGLGGYGSDFGPGTGVTYVWGHDDVLNASKPTLAYAYILCHIGVPMVYYTGNNITWDDYGRTTYPDARTWMMPGYDGYALGEVNGNAIPNLVWINQNFARASEIKRWEGDGDFFALERYDDVDANGLDSGDGIMLLALNDSGGDITKTLSCSFPNGTVLKDYTGNNGNTATVSGGQVSITVPGMGGQGFVVYAPLCADGVNINVKEGAATAGTMTWIHPGGAHASSTTQQITRITADAVTVESAATQIPAGITVDNIMLKWGNGVQLPVTNFFASNRDNRVSARFHNMNRVASTNYSLTFSTTNLSEGLHVIKTRAFTQRDSSCSAIFNTATKVVYVDRHGPELSFNVTNNQSMTGEFVLAITNGDYTAYGMTVAIDGAAAIAADQVMKGLWKFPVSGLSAGIHTATVVATEANYASPRQVINTSTYARVFQVVANPTGIGLSHAANATNKLPFFKTIVTGGSDSYSSMKLYWDGYELPFNGGSRTNVFDGQIIQRDNEGRVVTNRLWGNFINGPHYFEAERADGGATSRVVRRVVFNLYGNNHIDSDGDGIPDNVEMPFFDDGAPGPDQPWPGDSNNNFIPDNGETWGRLNPYNHSTFYSAQWDDRNDFDGDGYSNYDEVYAGYAEDGNIYKYDIYSSASKPSGNPGTIPSAAFADPSQAQPGANLIVTYAPNGGTLSNAAQVVMYIGHSKRTVGSWQDVQSINMAKAGSTWTATYAVPSNATSVDATFYDGGSIWDGSDWQFSVASAVAPQFTMDGKLDSAAFEISSYNGMKLWAAVRGTKLYVATWGTGNNGNDHFMYLNNDLGDAVASAWGKAGYVFLGSNHVFLAGEGDAASSSYSGWAVNARRASSANSKSDTTLFNYLEGEIDLADQFGSVPPVLYMAVGSYPTGDGVNLNNQVPAAWESNENIEVAEILRVPVSSILDENADGCFDGGNPLMWTVVNGNTNDANYGLRRFFLDEVKGDQDSITVILEPRAGGTNQVANVELFSNLNRRDYVQMPGDEDPDTVTTNSIDTYYKAWPMAHLGGGVYSATLPVNRCGAYRINARYKINTGSWRYYTDSGLRRDCAVVVSPKKALDTTIYELNPLTAEATSDQLASRSTFRNMYLDDSGRPNGISTNLLNRLGVNMVWLQPIHPIGTVGRGIDSTTGLAYEPGSPYAVKDYWQVNPVLGDPVSMSQAMTEFTNFVANYDAHGIGVMLDGTFNHSAWDCQIGQKGVDMGLKTSQGVTVNETNLISSVRPAWYSKKDSYGDPASYFNSTGDTDIAVAPDRIDFGKWSDAAEFFFGKYDCLVQKPAANPTNSGWSSSWYSRYLREDDFFEGFNSDATRELWEYFAAYPVYWLEKTGHPAGTPKDQSYKGIDGLRCDFAQGLPSLFWEYAINKTRSVKWDFLFMAESLDGYREVAGSKRHGVGYRSARHFDILNENMLYLWRDDFFDYRTYADQTTSNPNRSTALIWNAFDARKNAFEMSPVLLNLISHDEVFPTDDQWSLLYAYAINAAMDGVPMIFYGQEMGAQNNLGEYGARTDYEISRANNFARYETNFGKSIPHFKRYNHMTNIWNTAIWKDGLRDVYSRLNKARLGSPALQSQQNYFIPDAATTNWNPDIFAVAKFQQPGVSAATQDVVFAFINNNFRANPSRAASFKLNATTASGDNWFGIQPSHVYNVVDIAATNPTTLLWGGGITGSTLIANGIYVGFQTNATFSGGQAQYIRLLDTTAGMTATNVNDLFANEDRLPAPVIATISNRTVAVSNTLAFSVNVTKDPADVVTNSCASSLAPGTWSFTAPNNFSFTPTTNEIGVHAFLFTATGEDGFDEELITVTVTSSQEPTAYEQWASDAGLDLADPETGPSDDFDGDGHSNEEEFWADTDPADDNSFLQIRAVAISDNNLNLSIDKNSAAPRAYVIHGARQLAGNGWDWTVLGTNQSTTGNLPVNATNPTLMYKITIPAP